MEANLLIDNSRTSMRGIHLYGNCVGVQMECNYFGDCNEATYLGSPTQQVAMSSQGTGTVASENDWYPYNNSHNRVVANVNLIDWFYDNSNGSSYSNGKWPQATSQDITQVGFPYNGDLCDYPTSFPEYFDSYRDISHAVNSNISFESNDEEHNYNIISGIYKAYLYHDNMDSSWIVEYYSWLDSLSQENIGKLEQAHYILANANYESLSDAADEAYQIFSEITPNNIAEENKLYMLNIFYNGMLSGYPSYCVDSMSSENLESIRTIANQNSIVGGEAVLWARSMLKLFIDDDSILERKRGNHFKGNKSSDIILYPNPTTGIVFIENHSKEPVMLEIYDSQGGLKKRIWHLDSSQLLDLNLKNGLFYYRVISEIGELVRGGFFTVVN
jgi:hypothetical protein